jgi:hypothetical protein
MTPSKGQNGDLRPEDIDLREDGALVKIASFQGGELHPRSTPVELNLLFDDFRQASGAPVPDWLRSQSLNLASLDDHEHVSIAVWAYSGGLVRLTPPTRDSGSLNRSIERLLEGWAKAQSSSEGAPLMSAIAALARTASGGRTNVTRMVAVLTSGGAITGNRQDLNAVQETGVAVFPVILVDRFASAAGSDVSARSQQDTNAKGQVPRGLRQAMSAQAVAARTGGKMLTVYLTNRSDVLRGITDWLGQQIRSDYVASFYAPSSGERGPHKIDLKLKDSKRGKLELLTETVVH